MASMTSMDDQETKLGGKWVEMDQPPLLKLLQNILREYPKDAQIFHELVQNAEDAEASVIKILFVPETSTSSPPEFEKYFQSPGVCVYNDALFNEVDWKNIRSVCISHKETEENKIGKYGQGFKSIFHLTDHPLIVSGDTVLLIDPFRHDSCGYFDLKGIFSTILTSTQIKSCFDSFGLTEQAIQNNFYDGTLFWFPFRKLESELSKNVFTENKVEQLLNNFADDASIILLFLNHLQKIQMYNHRDHTTPYLQVERTCVQLLSETNFQENMIDFENTPEKCLNMKEIEIKTARSETPGQTDKWVIVNQTDRTSNNERDEFDIGPPCIPNISLAYHHASSEDKPMVSGRIFNYLPLPVTCITGLPVCVQGPFAISQNRRELKLPDKRSTDRFVLWNEKLFQLIPTTYKLLVNYLISTSERNGNSDQLVSIVYNCIPDIDKVETFWKPHTESVYGELLNLPIFFTKLKDNHWVTKEVALIQSIDNAVVSTRVTTFLLDHEIPVIKIAGNIPSILSRSKIQMITPGFIVNLLKHTVLPETYDHEMRLCLLEYILQDPTLDIEGIKLIPVENGDYMCFCSYEYDAEPEEELLLLSADQRRVFQGLEHKIVKTDDLSEPAYQKLKEIATSEKYQLYCLHLDDLPMLLQSVIKQHCYPIDTDGEAEIIEDSPLTIDWITRVWTLINSFDPNDLEPFEDIHLIPRKKPAANNLSTITHLLTMKKSYLFSSYEGCPHISSNIQTILESVGVEVIPHPCDVLQPCEHLLIGNYIKIPTFDSLIQLCKNNKDLQNKIQRILGFKRTLDLPNSEITSATSFGQKEDLTTRIKGILRDHPIDHSFINELLQNADDAGATEVHFVYDKRHHSNSRDGIFDERWKPLLGPALCVFNNACFTETDIKGIQELGIGGKCGDKSKAGQFGFGFNAVYHITDVPSFITKGPDSPGGGVFCAFDPHCKYAPYAHYDAPGMRMNLDELTEKYSSVYRSHIGDVLTSETGTWFRFPLRNHFMIKSSELLITKNVDPEKETLRLVECMKENIVESLIFLMNVNCIKISQIHENTDNLELIKKAEVDLTQSDANKRTRFKDSVGRNVQLLNSSSTYQCTAIEEYRYRMTINEENQHYKTYLVVQGIGLQSVDQTTRNVVNDVKRLPVGGVAILADSSENIIEDKQPKTKYRVFSTLPLPSTTGLTVHINGHFELDSSRKQLFESSHSRKQNDNRYQWNKILLQQNVSHVYVSCIEELKSFLFQDCKDNEFNILGTFLAHFPVDNTQHTYWQELLLYFYQSIKTRRASLFPVSPEYTSLIIEDTQGSSNHINKGNLNINIKWVYEEESNDVFFDNLDSQITGSDWRDSATNDTVQEKAGRLRQFFVNMGIKLSCGSQDLEKSFSKTCKYHNGRKKHHVYPSLSSLDFVCVCKENILPKYVSVFMEKKFKTLCRSEWETANKTLAIGDIKLCLDYLLKALNWRDIIGLPLLLADDGLVHPIQYKNEFFLSEYQTLLAGLQGSFVHRSLVPSLIKYTKECKSTDLFKRLDLENFATILQKSQDKVRLKSANIIDWNQKETPVAEKWIDEFWTFLKSLQEDDDNLSIPYSLHNWCLIPALFGTQKYLVPLGKGHCVVDGRTFEGDKSFAMIIKKLKIPKSLIKHDLKGNLSLLATYSDTNKTFDCMKYWITQHKIKLTCHECAVTLGYFGQNADNISQDRLRDIRKFCIFETINGRIEPLVHSNIVATAVDFRMPVLGLQNLFNSMNMTVLKYNPNADRLYKAINCWVPSDNAMVPPISYLYASWILPNIHLLNTSDRMVHLEYIRDHLLHDIRIKKKLKEAKFIPQNNEIKKASEFFDRNNKLFQEICEESEFPTTHFHDPIWHGLLKEAGMKTKKSKEILIDFAKRMTNISLTKMCYKQKTMKSKTLVEEIFNFIKKEHSNTDIRGFIAEIRTISFIFPQEIGDEFTSIHAGIAGDTLMRFQGSLSANRFHIVWSVEPTLPTYAMDDELMNRLHVELRPIEESVLKHTENICAVLSLSLKENQNDFVESIMEEIYEYFNTTSQSEFEILRKLSCVHVKKHNTFVRAKYIVKNVTNEEEIVPYLIQAPEEYAPYYKLFRFLGMTDTPTTQTYSKVLSYFYKDFGKERLDIEQIEQVEKAIKGLVQMLQTTMVDESQIDIDNLILMTTDYRLVPSSEIFLETRDDERQRIMKNGTLNLMADLTMFSLSKIQIEEIFMKLPEKFRPIFASTSIHEEVLSPDEFLNSDIADKLKDYLTSEHFIDGILRLAKYNASSRNMQMDESSLLAIESNLKTIQVCSVTNLQTRLSLNNRTLNETDVSKRCYLDKHRNVLYFTSFDVDAVKWLSVYDWDFAAAIQPLLNGKIERDKVLTILSKIDLSPLEFSKRLDDIGIPPKNEDGNVSFVPLPGSLVPKDLAEFLVPLETTVPRKSFVVFSDWKYVDTKNQIYQPNTHRYKYGVVIDVMLSHEQNAEYYILNVGDSSPRNMPISELFIIKEMSEINSVTFQISDDEYSHRRDLTLNAAVRFRMNQNPNPQPDEGKRWLQQAKYDFEVAKLTKTMIDAELSKGYNWICIICQQAAEKALKGAMYTINADEVHRVHSLTAHIPEGDTKLLPIARLLENTIESIEKMRYPIYRALPADLYDKEDAQKALDFTEQLINEVQKKYINSL
ncbi:sacsin-like [Mytilus californianus]|uniref:sacsin-like n=1 Tax=Mytilus californianus TaxID=6549 RepID=UPI002247AF71|nr:sacsin-like [Mytilus californianus]